MHIEGDWIIDEPTTLYNKTIVVDGDVYINQPLTLGNGSLLAGDLAVNDEFTVNYGEDVDLWCNYSGQYKVEVSSGGTLNVHGGLIWNNDYKNHYWFYMNGTLNIGDDPLIPGIQSGTIENTHGSPDLSQPGLNDPDGGGEPLKGVVGHGVGEELPASV